MEVNKLMNEKIIFSVKEVAEMLHSSPNYSYSLIEKGYLPAIKLGSLKILNIDEKAYSYNNIQFLTSGEATISSSFHNDIPFLLSQTNTKQEISQFKNERNSQNNIIDRFSYNEKIDIYDGMDLSIELKKCRHNVHITSNLNDSIYTRAP